LERSRFDGDLENALKPQNVLSRQTETVYRAGVEKRSRRLFPIDAAHFVKMADHTKYFEPLFPEGSSGLR
jgi:hypothetical protein